MRGGKGRGVGRPEVEGNMSLAENNIVSTAVRRSLSFLRRTSLARGRVFYFFLLFALIFSLLHLFRNGHWVSHIELTIKTPTPVFAKMKVATPRGVMDEFVFLLNRTPLERGEHRVEIRNSGARNPQALDSRVSIYRFKADDIEIPLGEVNAGDNVDVESDFLHIAAGRSLDYRGVFETAKIVFAYPPYSGIADVYLDDQHYASMDLYSHQGGYDFTLPIAGHQAGSFNVKLELPVSEIKSVRLELNEVPADFVVHSAHLIVEDHPYYLNPILDEQTRSISFSDEVFQNNIRKNGYLLLAKLVTAAVLALLLIELYLLVIKKQVFTRPYRSFWALFLISLSVISIGSLSAWPAIIQTDSSSIWAQVKYFDFFSWFSHVYSFFVLCLTLLYDSPATLTVVQTVLLSVTLAVFYSYLLRKGLSKAIVYLFFCLTVTSMQVLFYPAFFVRDVIYSIVTVLIFVVLFILLLEKKTGKSIQLNAWQISYLGAATAFAAAIRAEGFYLIIAVPLLYLLLLNRRQGMILFLSAMITFSALKGPLKSQLDVRDEPDYTLTLLFEPLGEIISQPHRSPDREKERAIIEKVINYEGLAQHHVGLEAFWSDRYLKRGQYTPEDIESLQELTVQLCILNPHIFIQNRARLFFTAIFAFSSNVEVLPDFQFVPRSWDFVERDKYLLAFYDSAVRSPWIIKFQKWMFDFVKKTLERDDNNDAFLLSPRTYLWNAAFGLLVTLLVASQWYFFRVTAVVSALILLRMLILFLFQPMAHFKYFFDICLWGYMVIPMALLELHYRTVHGRVSGLERLPLRDAIVQHIVLLSEERFVEFELLAFTGRGENASPYKLQFTNVSNFSCPHAAPRGESFHIKSAMGATGNFTIKMRSGDEIRLEASGFSFDLMIRKMIIDLASTHAGWNIPKPETKEAFVLKGMGSRRGEEAVIYKIHSHTSKRPKEKGITISEFEQAYSQLRVTGELSRQWFDEHLPACAKEGGYNFTAIGEVFQLFGLAQYSERDRYVAAGSEVTGDRPRFLQEKGKEVLAFLFEPRRQFIK
jgi:hypothetical protein